MGRNTHKFLKGDKTTMKVTLDLTTKDITVPKSFFDAIEKENEIIEAHDGTPVSPVDRIKAAFEEAMKDTDKHLRVKSK